MLQEYYRVVAPDRFLTTRQLQQPVSVFKGELCLVHTDQAIALGQGEQPEVLYVPIHCVVSATLLHSETQYQCRWKGTARYFHVMLPDGTLIPDGAWSYTEAPDEVAVLQTMLSFDTDLFEVTTEQEMTEVTA